MRTIYEITLGLSIALILLGGFVLLYVGGVFASTHWRSAWEGFRRAISYLRVSEQEEVIPQKESIKPSAPKPKRGPHGYPMTPNGRREMTPHEVLMMQADRRAPSKRPYGPFETLAGIFRFSNKEYIERTQGDINRLARRRPDWDSDDMSVDSQAPLPYGYRTWG